MDVSPSTYVARRIFAKYYDVERGFISPGAFKEDRLHSKADGHSVDLLWEGDVKPAKKLVIIKKCAEICSAENHDVVGWAVRTKKDLLNPPLSSPLSNVTRSPTETNPMHGTLEPRSLWLLQEGNADGDNKYRIAELQKKLHSLFVTSGGEFIRLPENESSEPTLVDSQTLLSQPEEDHSL